MSPAEFNVSESICQEQGLNLTCTNDERQLYISGHGQFYPGCIDIETATNVTGNPVHPSLQNNTNHTDTNGEHGGGEHGMTSGGATFLSTTSWIAVVVVVSAVGISIGGDFVI